MASANLTHAEHAIPDGWQRVRLGDVAEIKGGAGFPPSRQGRTSGDYPFIKVSDMTLKGNETYIRLANNYVDEQDVFDLSANVFSPGTVVFPKVGAAIATNKKRALTIPTIIDNNMVGVTVSDEGRCDARFLHNWFEAVDISQFANVSTVPSLTGSRLKAEPILLPPLPEQRAIAAVLDSIDDAIEGAEAVIAATEDLRDSLLHDLLTRGLPGQHTEFRDVPGLGTIPADWEVVRLGDVVPKFEYGTSVKCSTEPVGMPILRIPNIASGQLNLSDLKYAEFGPKESASVQLEEGDILLVRTNGNPDICGQCWVTDGLEGHWGFASYLVRGRADRARMNPWFAGHFLRSGVGRRLLKGNIRTSAGNYNLSVGGLGSMPVPCPPMHEQDSIVDTILGLIWGIEAAEQEATGLRLLKESSADALLTGQVRVTEVH